MEQPFIKTDEMTNKINKINPVPEKQDRLQL